MEKMTRREAFKKGGRIGLGVYAGLSMPFFGSGCSDGYQGMTREIAVEPVDIKKLKFTVVYDNFPFKEGLESDWGFSCVVEGLDKTILFDAGRYDTIFMSNLGKLGFEPEQIETIVISHDHPDHIGGMVKCLEKKSGIDVCLVSSFNSGTKRKIKSLGSSVLEVKTPVPVGRHCFSTGEMKNIMRNEHSLVIATDSGAIIITGCAHPGIVDIVRRAKDIAGQEVLSVLGGFHLYYENEADIREIISCFKDEGVGYVGPTHCSGRQARDLFAQAYKENCLDCGVGRIITADDFNV